MLKQGHLVDINSVNERVRLLSVTSHINFIVDLINVAFLTHVSLAGQNDVGLFVNDAESTRKSLLTS